MTAPKQTHVEIGPQVVTKFFPREILDVEVSKALALQDSGEPGILETPRVIDVDESRCAILTKRIHGMTPLRIAYLSHMKGHSDEAARFHNAGRVLAILHRRLTVSPGQPWVPSNDYLSALNQCAGKSALQSVQEATPVPLHGDFGFSNVLSREFEDSTITVVIDASPNGYSTFCADEAGPREIDLSHLIGNLQGRVPLASYRSIEWKNLPPLEEAVLDGYNREAGLSLNKYTIRKLSFADNYCYSARFNRTKRKMFMKLLYNSIKANNP